MRHAALVISVLLGCASWPALAQVGPLSPSDTAAAFKAAGFKAKGKKWIACAEGTISEVRDINGDGLPDAIISESGVECHGMTGEGYSLLSKQPNGAWKLVSNGTGIPLFLKTGAKGWPDLVVGGPGFCFPVLRWDGQRYAFNRHEYDGKRCKP